MIALFANDPRRRATLVTRGIIVAGAVLVIGAWVVTAVSIVSARHQELYRTELEARNFAAAFADEVGQTLNNVAGAMELVAQRMRAANGAFDIHTWAREIPLLSDATIQGAIIGPDGRLVSTTLDPAPEPIDLSDREHFRVHLDGTFPGMFISKPVTGRVSHQVTIQLTRRVDSADGKFLGVILFSLAPGQLTSLHRAIELGKRDVILLSGLDNVIRARFTREQPGGLAGIGQSIAGGPRPAVFAENASGSYVRKGAVDGIERVLGYHRVGKYPLVATVGLNRDGALAPVYRYGGMLGGFAALATLVLVGLGAYLIREIRWRASREIELSEALHRAKQAEALLHDAVDSISEAFVIYDADDRFVMCNDAYRRLYSESAEILKPGLRFEDLLRHGLAQRRYTGAIGREEQWLATRMERHRNPSTPSEAPFSGGRWILVCEQRMRNGGYAGLRVDITQLKETETRLRQATEYLDRVQQVAGIGSTTMDIATGHLEWSAGARAIFGIDGEPVEPTVDFFFRFIHPDDRASVKEAAERAIRDGVSPPPLEYRIVRPDGEVRIVYRETDLQLDSEDRAISRIATFKDITEFKATETRLRETLEHLDRVQRIAGIGSTTEDLATREYTWSPRACAIFGIDRADAGKTVEYMRQFYHPADRAKVVEAGELARLQDVPAPPLEYRIVRPDGAVRWVYRENDIQYDAEGRGIRRIVTFKDITDLKAKETQLRVTMDHLNRIQRISGIGSLEIDLRTKVGRITWSKNACDLFGLDPASVEPTPEFLLDLIHPDDRAKAKRASDRANATGTAAPPLEYRIVRPDGTERVLYRENAIQYDDSGEPVRRIVTYKDITAIKATEAQLRQTQDDLNRAQRLAKVGSDAWDLQTGNVVWSEETYRIFGVEPDEFTPAPETVLDLVVPEDRPSILARRKEIARGRCPAPAEFSIRRPDGEVRRIYSEGELIRDAKGKPTRWVGMRQDITEQARTERGLREAKEAAEAANVAKSQLLANTSHELRTPLNAIIGFSEMLGLGMAGRLGAKQKRYVALIHQSGQHLLNIINDILDLAHVDSGKFELHEKTGVDVRQVIDACVLLMRDRATTGGLRLSTEIDNQLPTLVADATRLKQILLNLMSNAIKFTEPGGCVAVIGRRERDGGVTFEVCDTGPGMTPDEIDIALTPFGQVDASHTRRYEGTGLGLPLAQRLAELHGGSLHISSKKGRGTTVTVKLPVSRTVAGTATISGNAADMAGAA